MPSIHIPDYVRNAILTPLLAVAYFIYEILVGHELFLFCWNGGSRRLGGFAFETPIMAPLAFTMTKCTTGPYQLTFAGHIAFVLILFSPILVGFFTAYTVQQKLNGGQNVFGSYKWKFWILLACWVFVPVPMHATLSAAFAD